MVDVGRNAPCPCGSGRKYKQCCAKQAAEAATDRVRRERAHREVLDRELRAAGALRDWLAAHPSEPLALDRALLEDPRRTPAALRDLAYVYAFYHRTPTEGGLPGGPAGLRYAARPEVSPEIRAFLEDRCAARLSLWRVAAVRPDEGLDLRDALTGETRGVRDRRASAQAAVGEVIFADVYVHGGEGYLGAVGPTPLEGNAARDALVRLRARLTLNLGLPAAGLLTAAQVESPEAQAEVFHAARRHLAPEVAEVPPPSEVGGDPDEAVRDRIRAQYAGWADHPQEALGGQTPRQVLAGPGGRAAALFIIEELAAQERRAPAAHRVGLGTLLRRQLGLEAR